MNILKIAPVVMFLIVSFAGAPWGVGQTTDNTPPNVNRNKASHVDELPVVFKEDFEKGLARWEIIDDQSWELEEHGAGKSLSIIRRNSEYEPKVRSPHHIAHCTVTMHNASHSALRGIDDIGVFQAP